jgi:signal transduction histidine kinase
MIFKNKDFLKTTRFKTTLWYAGLFLSLELVSALLIYLHLSDTLHKELDDSLYQEVGSIYNILSENDEKLKDFKPNSMYKSQEDLVYDLIFEEIILNRRNYFIQVKYSDSLIFNSDNLMERQIVLDESIKDKIQLVNYYNVALSNYEMSVAYLVKGNFDIIIAHPTVFISKVIGDLIKINLILIPTFFLLAMIGGAIISAKSLSRIDSIINKTKEITGHNLNDTIPGEEYNDEYGRLVTTMNEMILRIKTTLEYMNQFSTTASHELKTPLTILRGEIELALRVAKSADEYKQILQSNYEEALRLTNIVDKLFFLSKLDHSLLELKKEQININALIQPVVNQMQEIANKKNISVSSDVNNNFNLLVDIDLMRGAITNLVANAIKYADENTVVKISANVDISNRANISVNNKGRVIPKEIHEKIFERFFRSEASRSREPGGIGLGLSIAKSIVQFHNGKIWVESEPKNGTTFWISLDSKEI